jgi:DNA polymerase III alpha subunit
MVLAHIQRQVNEWGQVIFDGDDAVELLMRGCQIADLLLTPNVVTTQYNTACLYHDKTDYLIRPIEVPPQPPEEDTAQRVAHWYMPESYQTLAVRQRLLTLCQHPDAVARVMQEMELFEAKGLVPVLRLMWFLVDQFRAHNIVWGVGRGSSVASYCLFLIGIHKCDSLYYDLDVHEFLK